MIRTRCATCGYHINRTDQLFEDSDGTLCAACLARLAPKSEQLRGARPAFLAAPPPAWSILPELTFQHVKQG